MCACVRVYTCVFLKSAGSLAMLSMDSAMAGLCVCVFLCVCVCVCVYVCVCVCV